MSDGVAGGRSAETRYQTLVPVGERLSDGCRKTGEQWEFRYHYPVKIRRIEEDPSGTIIDQSEERTVYRQFRGRPDQFLPSDKLLPTLLRQGTEISATLTENRWMRWGKAYFRQRPVIAGLRLAAAAGFTGLGIATAVAGVMMGEWGMTLASSIYGVYIAGLLLSAMPQQTEWSLAVERDQAGKEQLVAIPKSGLGGYEEGVPVPLDLALPSESCLQRCGSEAEPIPFTLPRAVANQSSRELTTVSL